MGRLLDRLTLGRRRRYRAMMRQLRRLDRLDGSDRPRRGRVLAWPLLALAAVAAALALLWPTGPGRTSDLASHGAARADRVIGGAINELSDLPPVPSDARPTPLGTPEPAPERDGSFQFFFTQPGSEDPVTYDPCRPIHYVVRPDGAPRRGAALIEAAVSEISRRTGLQFAYDGETGEAPASERSPVQKDRYGNRWAPVLIAWSDAEETPELAGAVAGMGGSTYVEPRPGAPLRYVTGQVVLDASDVRDIMRRGSEGFEQARAIVMHEFAHLVGLEHVDDPAELMHPQNSGRTHFGPGDLQGLHELGLGACHRDT